MKFKNIFIIIFISVTILACKDEHFLYQGLNKEEVIFSWDDFGEIEKLNLSTVFEINTLGICFDFYKFDTLFYFNSAMQSDFSITITDMRGKVVNTTVAVGRGLNEVMSLFFMGQIKNKNVIYCYDGQMYHVVRFYNIDSLINKKYPIPEKIIDLGTNENSVLALFNENLFLTKDIGGNEKVQIVKSDKTVIKKVGQYNLSLNEINKYYINSAFSRKATIKPDNKRFALAYTKTDVLEIYDTSGIQLFAGHGPDNFNLYKFEPEKQKDIDTYTSIFNKSRYAYKKIQSTDEFIFALYSGKILKDEGPKFESYYLLIFDWTGKPNKAYKFSVPVSSFYYDEENNTIYTYNTNTETVYKAKLNP